MIRFRTDSCASSSVFISVSIKIVIRPCPRPCSHGYDTVPSHFGPFKKVVQRGIAFTWIRKKIKRSVPKQIQKLAIQKSGPEIGKIRYHAIQFSCEQKQYDIVTLSEPVWYLRVKPSWFLWPLLMSRLRLDLIAPH